MIQTVLGITSDPITYCLLCIGLDGNKDTFSESEKISDRTCSFCSFLGDDMCAAFAFAEADEKRQ